MGGFSADSYASSTLLFKVRGEDYSSYSLFVDVINVIVETIGITIESYNNDNPCLINHMIFYTATLQKKFQDLLNSPRSSDRAEKIRFELIPTMTA